MTPEYDLAVRRVNEYLIETGGLEAGAVQRLGAGWGGNMGGLINRDYIYGTGGTLCSISCRRAGY